MGDDAAPGRMPGRARATTHGHLSHVALELFVSHGFDDTTMDDVADAAGVSRRTLFRYYPSKNDLPWGDFDGMLTSMREHLASMPSDLPLTDALRQAVLTFNEFPAEERDLHRERMRLLLTVPALLAHSTLRFTAWRQVVADFAAERMERPAEALEPQALAWACLGVCIAAYEQWLADDDGDLLRLLDAAFSWVGTGATVAATGGEDRV
ncbi:mycofactocin system transcriptional regulator [Microbacterium thalassium]|uniref:Mycofactocin system transcriptional regulator n=1 Tax=Microbacterium thalassium TaxID=362649 RepID=A0A7X0FSC3_9MICO|nr:mycofactocin system transcriptional regulator [Microbacterium thalassium]MBB6392833.1 mycofactocin system transcriptional regulator [Microbacterium thalassium]GLK22936.1 putative transcriptional regulatory protein TetR [Microbacterium thalassium]